MKKTSYLLILTFLSLLLSCKTFEVKGNGTKTYRDEIENVYIQINFNKNGDIGSFVIQDSVFQIGANSYDNPEGLANYSVSTEKYFIKAKLDTSGNLVHSEEIMPLGTYELYRDQDNFKWIIDGSYKEEINREEVTKNPVFKPASPSVYIIDGEEVTSNGIPEEHNAPIRPYVLSNDRNDLLAGGSVQEIYIKDGVAYNKENDNPIKSDLIINDLNEAIFRGFIPDRVVYYSNDSKSTDNVVIYEEGKIIMFRRSAYRSAPDFPQRNLDY